MTVTNALFDEKKHKQGAGMTKKQDDTKPVRMHLDVALLAEKLAPIFGQTVPDFVSDRLRPVLESLREEGAAKLLERGDHPDEVKKPKKSH